jgi:hypothetical protein
LAGVTDEEGSFALSTPGSLDREATEKSRNLKNILNL